MGPQRQHAGPRARGWLTTLALLNGAAGWLACTHPAPTHSVAQSAGPSAQPAVREKDGAAPGVTSACLLGARCTEVTLAPGEAASPLEAECAKLGGRVVTACPSSSSANVCIANDVRMAYDLADPKALLEARRDCSLMGGRFSPDAQLPPGGKDDGPVLIGIAGLSLEVTLPDDCFTEEHRDVYVIGCGIGRRPATSLVASPYDGAPRAPEAVVSFVAAQTREAQRDAHVVETGRRVQGKEWRVEVSVVPKHGVAASGFVQLRSIRGVPILCRGQAFTPDGLREGEAMCEAIQPERKERR